MKKLQNTLYVMTADSYIFLQNEAVAVKIGGVEKIRIPANTLDSIYCFGNITVSTPLISFCGERGISLIFFSEYGRFYGRIEGPVHGNVLLRRNQYALLENEEKKVAIVKSMLLGKILNTKTFILREKREKRNESGAIAKAADKLIDTAKMLDECTDIDSMRGIEGVAAAEYFAAFPEIIAGSDMTFDGRNRRPPEDPTNALLSFLYTLLKNDMQSALEGVGLDPAVGFLHTLRPGRPALALDIMEELRVPMCDRLAVSLINKKQVTNGDFESLTPPVLLSDDARKTVVRAWQKRKQETIHHRFFNETIQIGMIPHAQAMLLARVVRGELDEYPPFYWR